MSGTTTFSEKMLTKLAVAAASEVAGVEFVSSSWAGLGARSYPRAEATIDRLQQRVEVTCSLAVSWPSPVTDVAARVQQNIRAWIPAVTGLEVTTVDVTVEQSVHGATRVSMADVESSPAAIDLRPVVAPGGARVRRPSISEPEPLRPIVVQPLFPEVAHAR